MIAEIISIGTEILLGDIVDSNSQYIARILTAYGYDIHYISSVGDNPGRLKKTLEQALKRADLIITTGGIGPTDDDITREIISEVSGKPLKINNKILEKLELFFKKRGYPMPENNKKQSFLPEGAKTLNNDVGTAPGILLEHKGKIIVSLPGVPREMKDIFNNELIPKVLSKNKEKIKSRVLNFFNIGESSLEEKIKDILDQQSNPSMALYAGEGEVRIRLTAKAKSEKKIEELLNNTENIIREQVDEFIYGVDEKNIASALSSLLSKSNYKLAVAESCTGGLVGNRITDFSGSSDYFLGGFIVYSNQAKINQLNVSKDVIEKYGAVSPETAGEMAENIREIMKADIGISLTGIAGPGGGSKEKPVGLVYLALSYENNTEIYKLNLTGNRKRNKWMSSQFALYYLYNYLRSKQDFIT
ncbi:competence/damage-inducible protein A [Natronospora cellulosivora (SeqCode)]